MRGLWLLSFALACGQTPILPEPPVETGTETDTTPISPPIEICDPLDGLSVLAATVTQPWSEHEALVEIMLSASASVAVACALDGDPSEVHLAEGAAEVPAHALRLAGLLAGATYHCTLAPVCPSSVALPVTLDLVTGPESNALLPTIQLVSHDPRASGDYVVTNHQHNGSWNGQRRLVIDRDGRVRWRAAATAGGGAGGPSFAYSPQTGTFTIGGGWPPNNNGRPQQLDPYGSTVLYDTLDVLPNADQILFHHEGRQVADGRLLSLEVRTVTQSGGGTFDGFGVHLVDPQTDEVTFDWTSQAAYDIGALPGGGGDAYHANWADVVGDVLYVSLCYLHSVVAVDVSTGNWRWKFGPGGDFALVDADGSPLSDDEYPQCQHGLKVEGNKLLVYDNGQWRGYSRVVEYELDEAAMVATKRWDWTEPNWFEQSLGGADYTSEGGVLVAMGHIESATPSPGDHTTFVEIDPATGEKRWEIRYTSVDDMAYRAQSVPPCDLFANGKYCPAIAARRAALAPILGELR